mgnify:CR=1 FL=1
MSGVRVLVGTRKGAFILTSDEKRQNWAVSGPHFAGWEIYHMKGSRVNPNRIYASQSTGWFGQLIQRSDDGGQTWEAVNNEFAYDGDPGTHQFYDGTQHPWEFKRVWHLEPSLTEPDTVYAGVEDAALGCGGRGGARRGRAGTFRVMIGVYRFFLELVRRSLGHELASTWGGCMSNQALTSAKHGQSGPGYSLRRRVPSSGTAAESVFEMVPYFSTLRCKRSRRGSVSALSTTIS